MFDGICNEIILTWGFFGRFNNWFKFLNYQNIYSDDLFLLIWVLVAFVFRWLCSFHLHHQICGHIIMYSYPLLFNILGIISSKLCPSFLMLQFVCFLFYSWIAWLELYQYYWSFQKSCFCFWSLCPVFSVLNFFNFCSKFY